MLNSTFTNYLYTNRRPIVSTAIPVIAEGQALVGMFELGMPKAAPSTGSATDAFLGIALGPRRTFSMNVTMETITVPAQAPFTVLLKHTVLSAPGIYNAAGGELVSSATADAPAGGADPQGEVEFGIDPTTGLTVLTFDASFAGATFNTAYEYAMSPTEEIALFGNAAPGFPAEQILQQVEFLTKGECQTNNFDPQANWYAGASTRVKMIAGGIFTDANNAQTGVVLPNVSIKTLPTPDIPYLGLELE